MTSPIDQMLAKNREFVDNREYTRFEKEKMPRMKTAIVTCMDTRLVELLPASLGIKNSDVKMIKNAGGLVTDPWDSAMRSILVAVYELGVTHVMIIAHTNCGVQGMEGAEMLEIMKNRGIPQSTFNLLSHSGIDLEKWLTGFSDTAQAVQDSVDLVKNHPLLPDGISVEGFIFDTDTALLSPI